MASSNNSRRLVELAFDAVLAETEQQAEHSHKEAATLATESDTFRVWLELIDFIKAWDDNQTHAYPMSRGSALQFFLTRQAELEK